MSYLKAFSIFLVFFSNSLLDKSIDLYKEHLNKQFTYSIQYSYTNLDELYTLM